MLKHVLRHRVNASVSYKPGNFYANTLIHSGKRQSLWAGLTVKSLERASTNSFGSKAQDIPKDTVDISSEISKVNKAKTVKNGEKKRRKRRKKAIQDGDLTLAENGKKIKKRTVKKISEKATSEITENQNHESQDEDRPPTVSFPFEGSSYTETDDEFGINHRDVCDLHCSGDRSVIHRMDDCTPEGRFYHISSASESVVFPSVTTVLSHTLTKSRYYMLRNWKKSMVKEHGEEGFESIQQQTKDTGTHFHKKLEQKLVKLMLPDAISIKPQLPVSEKFMIPSLKRSFAVDTDITKEMATVPFDKSGGNLADKLKLNINKCAETDSGYMKSVRDVLEQITSVLALESVVTHHELGYTGTLDCVAKYRGEVCLVDWKSSARPKPTLKDCYDFPLQAVAYAGAINYDDHYQFKVFNALIVVAYADGEPAHAHFLSHEQCQHYWSKWLHRLQEYQTQFASDHSNVY